MSWSISFVGDPEKIGEAIKSHAEKLVGTSKEEFDEVAPHLAALVALNFNKDPAQTKPGVLVEASGHGYKKDGVMMYSSVQVKIRVAAGLIT